MLDEADSHRANRDSNDKSPPPAGSRSWQEFMAERAEKHRKEAEAKRKKLGQIERDLAALDKAFKEIDERKNAEIKPWSKMSEKEKHDYRRAYVKANPGADPQEVQSMFNRLDRDPNLTPGDMMLYTLGETVLGLPSATYESGKGIVKGVFNKENVQFLGDFFDAYKEDVASGAQIERLATARVFDYFSRPGELLKDLQDAGTAAGGASEPLGQAAVDRASAMMGELHEASLRGDGPAIAKVLDKIAGDALAETVLTFGMGKVAGMSKTAIKGFAAKIDDAVKSGGKGPGKPPGKPGSPTPDAKPPSKPRNMTDAPDGSPIDSASKAAEYGVTQDEMKSIQDISEEFNVNLTTRPSNPARLQHLGSARMKPEAIKAKSINQADLELGFRKQDEGLLGALTDDMYADLKGMSQADIAKLSPSAQARRLDRLDEFDKRGADLTKVEHGVPHRTPDPNNPGKQITENLQAKRDKHGVIRDPEGKGFTGDIDLDDITHSDGRAFFRDHDGRMLGYDANGVKLKKGSPQYDSDMKTLRSDRETMSKVLHAYKERVGGEHGGGYWNPKAGLKFDKDGIPQIDCKNLELNARVNSEAAEGLGVVRFGPGGKPRKVYGKGTPRYGGKFQPGKGGQKSGWKGGYKPEYVGGKQKPKLGPKSGHRPGALKPKPTSKPGAPKSPSKAKPPGPTPAKPKPPGPSKPKPPGPSKPKPPTGGPKSPSKGKSK